VIAENGATLVELRAALHSEFASLSADMVGFRRSTPIAAGALCRQRQICSFRPIDAD
jgi:hypothetical protein